MNMLAWKNCWISSFLLYDMSWSPLIWCIRNSARLQNLWDQIFPLTFLLELYPWGSFWETFYQFYSSSMISSCSIWLTFILVECLALILAIVTHSGTHHLKDAIEGALIGWDWFQHTHHCTCHGYVYTAKGKMGKYALLFLTYYLNNTINLLIRDRSYMESMALAFWVLIATENQVVALSNCYSLI